MSFTINESHYIRPTTSRARQPIIIEGEQARTLAPKPNTPNSGTTIKAHTAEPQPHTPIRTIEATPVKDDAQLLDASRIYTPHSARPAFTNSAYNNVHVANTVGSTIDTFV